MQEFRSGAVEEWSGGVLECWVGAERIENEDDDEDDCFKARAKLVG
jgi:hypothetical protein